MKLKNTLFLLFIFSILTLSFQLTNGMTYSFAGSSPSTPATGNWANIVIPLASQDDWDTLVRPSGFNYYLEGTSYSGIIISTNGWVALAPTGMTSVPPYFGTALPVNSLNTYSGGLPLFAPLWDDNSANLISFNLTGTVLTIRWNIRWDKSYSGNFESLIWMTLDQSTGEITFNYSTTPYLQPFTVSASIGITGMCNGSFYSVTPGNIAANSTVSTTVEDSLIAFKPVDTKFVFTPGSGNMIWYGTVDTLYDEVLNWNDCTQPDCNVNAYVGPTVSGRMPIVRQNESVHDLTIDSGASITIVPGVTLSICGNLINNGSFIAQPGSTVRFINSLNQTVTGSFTSTNAFANVSLLKTGGTMMLNNDIDVKENFSVNSTSTFDINGKYVRSGGNFSARNITGIGNSTVEFNGNGDQVFTSFNDHLNNVKVNKNLGKVRLSGSSSNMIVDSILDLTSGIIATSPSLFVYVVMASSSAIINYSANSYIDGLLKRSVYLGSIDFPVGDSLVPNPGLMNGYELANVTFTSPTHISNIISVFRVWPSIIPVGPTGPDSCGIYLNAYDSLNLFDNGYWWFQNNSVQTDGAYNLSLYSSGGTNSIGPEWTIATAMSSMNPGLASSWRLEGKCNQASTLSVALRDSFNLTPDINTSFNHIYAIAQGSHSGFVSVNEIYDHQFSLIPNPLNSTEQLKLYSSKSSKINFELVDMSGRTVFNQQMNLIRGNNILPELNLSKGIYLGRLTVYDEIRNIKLVVE